MASRTGDTVSTLCLSPETNVVALRGPTMPGLPEIGQSSRSPPLAFTWSRRRALRSTSMVLISMWMVPGFRVLSVPAGPSMISSTSLAVGDDREDDVCAVRDLGRAGGGGAALLAEFGRAAAAVAGDVEAARHQVPGDGQAHLAQADHA